MCIEKLSWLAATAGIKTLFENEVRSSGRELEPGVYDEYRVLVHAELEKLRSLPTPDPLLQRCHHSPSPVAANVPVRQVSDKHSP